MNRFSCHLAIWTLFLSLAGDTFAAVPLADLTPKLVAERLNAYLNDKTENRANWERKLKDKGLPVQLPAPEESRFELTVDRTTGEVRKFEWVVPTREPLPAKQRQELDAVLKDLFVQAAVQFIPKDGPLLEEKDAKTLYERLAARTGPMPPPTLTVTELPRTTAGKPVTMTIEAKGAGRPAVELPKSPDTRIDVKPLPSGSGWTVAFPAPSEPGTYDVRITLASPDGLVATATKAIQLAVEKPPVPETLPVPSPAVARVPVAPQVVVGLVIVSSPPWGGGPTIVPVYAPAYGGPSYWYPPSVPPQPVLQPAPRAAAPRVPTVPNVVSVARGELLAAKDADPWVWYDCGLASYWSGATAQAVEYLAAAAAVSNDPRIWSYLSLALESEGKAAESRDAGRFAAAAKVLDEEQSKRLAEALERVQGTRRATLEGHASGVNDSNASLVIRSVRDSLLVTNPPKPSAGGQ